MAVLPRPRVSGSEPQSPPRAPRRRHEPEMVAQSHKVGRAAARHLLVPLTEAAASRQAVDVACRLAREHRARVVAVATIEVPLDLPLATPLPQAEERARSLVDTAQALCDGYGVTMR